MAEERCKHDMDPRWCTACIDEAEAEARRDGCGTER